MILRCKGLEIFFIVLDRQLICSFRLSSVPGVLSQEQHQFPVSFHRRCFKVLFSCLGGLVCLSRKIYFYSWRCIKVVMDLVCKIFFFIFGVPVLKSEFLINKWFDSWYSARLSNFGIVSPCTIMYSTTFCNPFGSFGTQFDDTNLP